MEYYTLLADDNQRLSHADELCSYFRAHMIYNMIVGGGMVFSDNQVICSNNIRKLVREDGVIRELFKEKRVGLAIRDSFLKEGQSSLQEVFDAFHKEGKIKHASKDFGTELEFIANYSVVKPWTYERVRQNYTKSCLDIIDMQFQNRLSPSDHAHLMDILAEEKIRDGGGLGREFLQGRLPKVLAERQIFKNQDAFILLKNCTEAPYLSNLPETMGLSPIYTQEQKPSFDLLRGHHQCNLIDTEAPTDLNPKLDYKHFVHGLNRLDIDDILHLLDLPAFTAYRTLMKSSKTSASLDELHLAFVELNIQIEDRIISRFPEIKVHSPQAEARKVRKFVASLVENGSVVLLDLVGVGLLLGHIDLMVPAIAITPFINRAKKMIKGAERPYFDAALHEVQKRKLISHLHSKGKLETMNIVENIQADTVFSNEVMVA